MKKIHQVVRSVSVSLLVVLVVLSISSASTGVLHFKMTAPKTTLDVNEEVTVTVSAWVDDPIALPNNGLDTWQLDLRVNNTGIIEITKNANPVGDITLLAPNPDFNYSGWDKTHVNLPITGEVHSVAVVQQVVGAPSYTGVGDYSDIFTFKIKAIALGTATYTICDDGGGGFFAFLANNTYYEGSNITFDAGISNNTFTVVTPEPASLTLFALAGILASIRRKK
ncbi:MAG: PEP-CTERM sorting domain-containing protein [Sedimentisphaerales bacterium]